MPSGHTPSGGAGGFSGSSQSSGGFTAKDIAKKAQTIMGFALAPQVTLGGLALDAWAASQANTASAKQAQINRDFQSGMSSTAHQREVKDLRAAGLNPILSGTGGAGAATPGGATARQIPTVTQGAATALASFKQQQEIKNMDVTIDLILADITKSRASSHLQSQQAISVRFQGFKEDMLGQLANKSITEKQLSIDILREQLKMWKREGEITGSEAGLYLRWLSEISKAAGGLTSLRR